MLKISISASRALVGFGIVASLSSLNATDISSANFDQYFKKDASGNYVLETSKQSEDLTFNANSLVDAKDPQGNVTYTLDNKNIVINTNYKVTFDNFTTPIGSSYDITTAKGVEFKNATQTSIEISRPINITSKALTGTNALSANKALITTGVNQSLPLSLKVDANTKNATAEVSVTNSLFGINFNNAAAIPTSVTLITGATKYNNNILTSNNVVGNYMQSMNQVINNNLNLANNTAVLNQSVVLRDNLAEEIDDSAGYYGSAQTTFSDFTSKGTFTGPNDSDVLVKYELTLPKDKDGKDVFSGTLSAVGKLNVNEKSLTAQKLAMAKQLLKDAQKALQNVGNWTKADDSAYTAEEKKAAKDALQALINELSVDTKDKDGKITKLSVINALQAQYDTASTTSVGKLTEAPAQFSAIANGLSNIVTSKVDTATQAAIIELAMDSKKLASYLSDINSTAKSHTDAGSATSSANTAINLSNDVSITARAVQYNNPYLAAKQFKDKTASVASDAYYYKANNYANSVWANTFGGLNIYDGENSGIFGISFGYDREVAEGVILGVYGTYASSELKDKVTKNEADNFQFGVYSNIKFAQTWESNFKVYGQVAKVDTTNTTNVGTTQGDFTQRFFGVSGNVGKVFNPADGFYIKPFVGANYYYGYTPNYTETGVLAKHVRSTSNDTLSLEIGG
ncbi:MAG: autotransporter domain-containing protein, partial [Helicobacteraceae bacterium]|nr:autotransporter domain-containing protein [Helicobacteraceae bacterium]